MLKLLVQQLAEVLGSRMAVERAGGRFRKSDEIKSVQIVLGNDTLEADVEGAVGPLQHRPRLRRDPHSERAGRHGRLADPPPHHPQQRSAHSEQTRLALEHIVIGGSS